MMAPGASWGRWQAGVCVGTRRAVCIGSHSGVRTKQGSVFAPSRGSDTLPCSVRPQSQEPDRRLLSVPCLTAYNDFGNAEKGDAILTISFLWL